MISREEALDKIEIDYDVEGYEVPNESLTSYTETINIISEIYKSIGTCGECKFMYIEDELPFCNRGSFDPIEESFYCADFERKQNDR